jgi:hypothetical protein
VTIVADELAAAGQRDSSDHKGDGLKEARKHREVQFISRQPYPLRVTPS